MPPLPLNAHNATESARQQQPLGCPAREKELVDIAEMVGTRSVHTQTILMPPNCRLLVIPEGNLRLLCGSRLASEMRS